MELNPGKSSVSWAELADESDERQRTTENGSLPPLLPHSESDIGAEDQDKEFFAVVTEVEDEPSLLPPPVAEKERLDGIQNMPLTLQPSDTENWIICAEEQNQDSSSVCVEVPPLPLFPLSESNNGETVLEEAWPSLPSRSSMQGMLPLPSLPLSGTKSGGWMELFANNKENSAVASALSSQRRNIKRTPTLPLISMKQQNRDCTVVPPQFLTKTPSPPPVEIEKTYQPPPVEIEQVEEKSSQPLYLAAKERKMINEHKSIQETFQNPFALLADMENEKEDAWLPSPPQVAEPPSVRLLKRKMRRRSKRSDGVDQNQRTRMASWKKIIKSSSFVVFVITLLCIFPFGK